MQQNQSMPGMAWIDFDRLARSRPASAYRARVMRQRRFHRWLWISLGVLAVVLVGVRLMLPTWVADYLNRRLDRMGEYHGELASVDIHLWRGAYSINALHIDKRTGKVPVPLLKAPRIDLSVSWKELAHGAIVAKAVFVQPELNFVDAKAESGDQSGKGVDWRAQLEGLMPLRLDEVQVRDGRVHFRNFGSNPPVDLEATRVNGVVTHLSNARAASRRAASFDLSARILGDAPVTAQARFDPLGSLRDFQFAIKVSNVDLRKANDFLQAYAKVDVERGSGDFVMELEATKGRLDGYAKPLFHDVQLFSWKHDIQEQHDNPLRAAWEALAGGLQNIFKNHRENQFATRVEIHGTTESRDISAWDAIAGILHNAFVEAFRPTFESLPAKKGD